MRNLKNIVSVVCIIFLGACDGGNDKSDAYGNFEAIEIIVSAEGNGKLIEFNIEEGDKIAYGQRVGVIDTMQLYLKKRQLEETIKAVQAKLPDIASQINVLKERLSKARYEQKRLNNLVRSEAAMQKQLDDINAEVSLIEKEIIATNSSLTIQQRGLLAEVKPLEAQIKVIEDLISKSIIKSPVKGTVLTKFAQRGELTSAGRSLYKIADLDTIICRAYIGEPQLSGIKIGQKVTVLIDAPKGDYKSHEGKITWVADKAEFTPKVIQTKDERINLVYAIKIAVKNDGSLKIGMPAEIKF